MVYSNCTFAADIYAVPPFILELITFRLSGFLINISLKMN